MQEHPLLIVDLVNAALGPLVRAILEPFGFHFDPAHPVNDAHANVYYDRPQSQRKRDAKKLADLCKTAHQPSF